MVSGVILYSKTNLKNRDKVVKSKHDEIGKLISEYQPQLKSFIRKRVASSEEAEDILQDVFYQLVKTVNTTMNPIEHVAAWLYRVARNTIINHGLKKREDSMPVRQNNESDNETLIEFSEILFNNDISPSPEAEYLRSLFWDELENALSRLPSEQREIFELTELEGFSMKEISQTTGIPINTLLSRKHYAVLYLRKQMRELYEEIVYRE